jgi:hypothetical protein
MPDEEKPSTAAPVPVAPQRKIEFVTPPEGLTRFYANNIAMGSSKFDVRIVFGEIRDVTETTAIVDNRFQVTLAWAAAKLLGDFLQANVKAFEELNGPIKLPKIPAKVIVPVTFPES